MFRKKLSEEKRDEPSFKRQWQLKIFGYIIPLTEGLEYTIENFTLGTELGFYLQSKLLEAIDEWLSTLETNEVASKATF